jgi:D-glycero-D-manno-heptose 1,7-bisphosphate phosphatase
MILQAAKKYNIDLSQSFMAGDDMRDINAGLNAGCKTVYLGIDTSGKEAVNSGAEVYPNLKEFAASLAAQ